jgi:hypothetical protein
VYGNHKSENSQDYAQKTSTKLYVHEFGFCLVGIRKPKICPDSEPDPHPDLDPISLRWKVLKKIIRKKLIIVVHFIQ